LRPPLPPDFKQNGRQAEGQDHKKPSGFVGGAPSKPIVGKTVPLLVRTCNYQVPSKSKKGEKKTKMANTERLSLLGGQPLPEHNQK